MKQLASGLERGLRHGLFGAAGGVLGSLLGEAFRLQEEFDSNLGSERVYFGVVAISVLVALLLAQQSYQVKSDPLGWRAMFQGKRRNGLVLALLLAFFAGYLAAGAAQLLFNLNNQSELLRIAAIGLFGGLLGMALALRVPNLLWWRGGLGGWIGGLAGGVGFVLVAPFVVQVARALGMALLGGCIGLMIVLVEAALRKAWLTVCYGEKPGPTVTLGARPVIVGGDPGACDVYAALPPGEQVAIGLESGQVVARRAGGREVWPTGSVQVVGNATLRVDGAGTAAAGSGQRPRVEPALVVLRLNDGRRIPLMVGTVVTAAEVPGAGLAAGQPVASVTTHPSDPTAHGLRNETGSAWRVTLFDGSKAVVEPGRNVRLRPGTRIDGGGWQGELIAWQG